MIPNIRFVYAVVLGLSLLPVQAWPSYAADPAQPSPSTGQSTDQNTNPSTDQNKEGQSKEGMHHRWCKDDPEKCKERREQWCKDNPEKCKERKEKHEQWCKDHPDKCGKHDGDSSAKPSDKPSDSQPSDSATPAPGK